MINIYYDPTLDTSSTTPEPQRSFNTGSRVITLQQGNNIVDEITLMLLESLSTFRVGEDNWFKVDRNFTPPESSDPQLEQPTGLEVTLEESSEPPIDESEDDVTNG